MLQLKSTRKSQDYIAGRTFEARDATAREMCREPTMAAKWPPNGRQPPPSLIDRLERQAFLAKDHDGLQADLREAITKLRQDSGIH